MTAKNQVTKPEKPAKPTKKFLAAEKRALQNFDNMCHFMESVTPAFIQTNIETLNRASFSDESREYIAQKAAEIAEKAKTNKKITLPKEWDELLVYNIHSEPTKDG